MMRKLGDLEYKLVLAKFVPTNGTVGELVCRTDSHMTDSVQTRLYNARTTWLSTRLADWDDFPCHSAQRLMMCTIMARWLFWMTVLGWGHDVNHFCESISQSAAERERASRNLEKLVFETKVTLLEAYSILRLHQPPQLLEDPNIPVSHDHPPLGKASRNKPKPKTTNDHDHAPARQEVEIIGSSAPRIHVEITRSALWIVPQISIQLTKGGPELRATLDTGAAMSVIDRSLLAMYYPQAAIKKWPHPSQPHEAGGLAEMAEYAILNLFIPAKVNGKSMAAKITQHFNVVNDPVVAVIVGFDIIKHNGIVIDTVQNEVLLTRCANAKAPLTYQQHNSSH